MPDEPVGAQADPWDPPAPYTYIQMGDIEEILDWELDQSPDISRVAHRGGGCKIGIIVFYSPTLPSGNVVFVTKGRIM
jgi:hypothetical protein